MITFPDGNYTKVVGGSPTEPLRLTEIEAIGNFQEFDHRLRLVNLIVDRIATTNVHLELQNVRVVKGGKGVGLSATQSSSPKGTVGLVWSSVIVAGYEINVKAEIDHLTTIGLRSAMCTNIGIQTGIGSMITHLNPHHYQYSPEGEVACVHPFAFADVGMATTLISPAWEQSPRDKSPAMFSMWGNPDGRKPTIIAATNNYRPNSPSDFPNLPLYDNRDNYRIIE